MRSIADTDKLLTDITQTRKMLDKFEFLTKSSQARFRRTEAGIGNNSHYSMRRLTSEEAMKLYLIKLRKELEAKVCSPKKFERSRTFKLTQLIVTNVGIGSHYC